MCMPLPKTGLSMNNRPDGAEAHLRRYLMWHRPNVGGVRSKSPRSEPSPTKHAHGPMPHPSGVRGGVQLRRVYHPAARGPAESRLRSVTLGLELPQKPQEHSATWLISARVCAACGVCATARGFVVPRARPAALGHGGAPPAGGILSRMPGAVLRSCFRVGGASSANAQTAPAATSTTPAHQLLGPANAEMTPAPAAAADRMRRPDAARGGGRMGDCPRPLKETATRRNVTQGGSSPPPLLRLQFPSSARTQRGAVKQGQSGGCIGTSPRGKGRGCGEVRIGRARRGLGGGTRG